MKKARLLRAGPGVAEVPLVAAQKRYYWNRNSALTEMMYGSSVRPLFEAL